MNILEHDYNNLSWDKKRVWLKEYYNYTCQKCNNNLWLGEQIPLEINHINGNNQEHELENVELLCCNCHALTDNWRGRNKIKREFILDRDLIQVLVKNKFNIRQSLIEVNLSPKGGNYKRCNTLIQKYKNGIEIKESKYLKNKPINKEEVILLINKKFTKTQIISYYNISSTFLDKKLIEFGLNELYYKYNKQHSHNIKEVIKMISNSNIDFSKRGWTKELSKIIEKTPSYSNKIIKEKFPKIWDMCYKNNN
jgi:hypothetical protein